MKRTCDDIRNDFLAFFEQRGHTFVPSSPLLPAEDPTLLFANAGMNQFKEIFLGTEKRNYVRAHNSQKCIRAGGKHNDLEDVGHDTYHHTFFEMLGNWSFGDYFKAEAIKWAWELLTEVWKLPAERLYATVFEGDQSEDLAPDVESERLWKDQTGIDASHVMPGGRKDNFWEMGRTGPCGPCSEVHIDLTDDGSGGRLVNAGDPRTIEIWNLVFIQFDRDKTGRLSPLPAKHVDTGMGLERICAVLQGKTSNYATDLFVPIIEKIETLTDHRYGGKGPAPGAKDRFDITAADDIRDVACRVIADHARTLTFAIADGVIPSNEGRGYVLRRILRRAARYARQYLSMEGPFLVELVPTVVQMMSGFFPEVESRGDYIVETLREEEESFGRTLDRGIELFQKEVDKLAKTGKRELGGEVTFDLYATYGFPVDLTQIMASERGITVDTAGYEVAMAEHKETSSSAAVFRTEQIPDLPATNDSAKYAWRAIEATVLGWVAGGQYVTSGRLDAGAEAAVVLDKTSLYAEQGGQAGDTGELSWEEGRFVVSDTQVAGGGVLHIGRVESGSLAAGQSVLCEVSASRMDTMRNHTATHLLNWALRQVLGEHVNQAGSVVAPDRLRFDFSHNQAVTADQLRQVERMVNERVLADEPVVYRTIPLADARKIPGVRAVFGEKYPDPVRVVAIGTGDEPAEADASCSVEFCGGTHLVETSQVGLFKIISEESVAKGMRRITAVTGRGAVAYVQEVDGVLAAAASALRVPHAELPHRIEAMQKEIKDLRKRGPAGKGAEFEQAAEIDSPHGKVIVGRAGHCDAQAMRKLCDVQRQKGAAAVFVGGAAEGKVLLVAMVTDALVATGKPPGPLGGLRADQWVKAVAPIVGGGGGGKDTLAQAGGKQEAKLPEALDAAAKWAREQLG